MDSPTANRHHHSGATTPVHQPRPDSPPYESIEFPYARAEISPHFSRGGSDSGSSYESDHERDESDEDGARNLRSLQLETEAGRDVSKPTNSPEREQQLTNMLDAATSLERQVQSTFDKHVPPTVGKQVNDFRSSIWKSYKNLTYDRIRSLVSARPIPSISLSVDTSLINFGHNRIHDNLRRVSSPATKKQALEPPEFNAEIQKLSMGDWQKGIKDSAVPRPIIKAYYRSIPTTDEGAESVGPPERVVINTAILSDELEGISGVGVATYPMM